MSDAEPTFSRAHGIIAVLDTSVLVRAWLSKTDPPNAARTVMLLAGIIYDSFTSEAILNETKAVLARPRFGADHHSVDLWLDAFVRASRQVFPQIASSVDLGAVGGDADDLPILETAYAVLATASEHDPAVAEAQRAGHLYLVSDNTTDFVPGRNVHGFRFTTGHDFRRLLVNWPG